MSDADVLIVGGGPAGLTTAGALKQAGIESTIVDAGECIGQSWERRYDRLHLHTVRRYSGLAHYPISSKYPKYLSKDQYASYLRDYAAHFDLNFVSSTPVKRVRQVGQGSQNPDWEVETSAGAWHTHVVVISTGQFGQPVLPQWPGMEKYGGISLHSSAFRTGQAYHGQRVLVVGTGNSGMEIAVDLTEQGAAQVTLSVRSGPSIVPRDFLGVPAQVFAILMKPFPVAVSDAIASMLSRLALGDLTRLGLPSPGWKPFTAHRTPVIDVGFAPALKAGKVSIRPAVQSFTPSGVIFQDGRSESFDVVIFATGFRSGLEQLLEPAGLLDQYGNPRFHSGVQTACPGLYFMGFFDTLRGFLYESNLASQRLAREIKASI